MNEHGHCKTEVKDKREVQSQRDPKGIDHIMADERIVYWLVSSLTAPLSPFASLLFNFLYLSTLAAMCPGCL